MADGCAMAMVVVDPETFLRFRRALPAATKEKIQETFGVSETTWVKLRDGRPLKRSTLLRIEDRYVKLAANDSSAPLKRL